MKDYAPLEKKNAHFFMIKCQHVGRIYLSMKANESTYQIRNSNRKSLWVDYLRSVYVQLLKCGV